MNSTFKNDLVAELVELVKVGNQVYLTEEGFKELIKILATDEYEHIAATFQQQTAEAV